VKEYPPHLNSLFNGPLFNPTVNQSSNGGRQTISQAQPTTPTPTPSTSSDVMVISLVILLVPLSIGLGIVMRQRYRHWHRQKQIQALERAWEQVAESSKDSKD
jgi:uncharacterized protein HemX